MGTSKTSKQGIVARSNTPKKNIACLESLWDEHVAQPITVAPLLDVIGRRYGLQIIHFTCNTKEELEFCLGRLPTRSNYRILYLALHGEPGAVALGDGSIIPLLELSALMGTKFKDWIVYFGTCDTMAASNRQLQQFLESTRAALLIGYCGSIDWVDSAALDLIVLDWLESYKSLASFWKRVRKDYRDLIRLTRLKIVSPTKRVYLPR